MAASRCAAMPAPLFFAAEQARQRAAYAWAEQQDLLGVRTPSVRSQWSCLIAVQGSGAGDHVGSRSVPALFAFQSQHSRPLVSRLL